MLSRWWRCAPTVLPSFQPRALLAVPVRFYPRRGTFAQQSRERKQAAARSRLPARSGGRRAVESRAAPEEDEEEEDGMQSKMNMPDIDDMRARYEAKKNRRVFSGSAALPPPASPSRPAPIAVDLRKELRRSSNLKPAASADSEPAVEEAEVDESRYENMPRDPVFDAQLKAFDSKQPFNLVKSDARSGEEVSVKRSKSNVSTPTQTHYGTMRARSSLHLK